MSTIAQTKRALGAYVDTDSTRLEILSLRVILGSTVPPRPFPDPAGVAQAAFVGLGAAMVKPAEGYESRSSGALVRIEPVHWDGQGRVALIGEIDLSNVRETKAALSYMVCQGEPLTLDLVGLSYLDSQGVGMLFQLAMLARREGGSLTLANPQNLVRRVLSIVHLEDAVAIIDDV